jgi:hypothetical protein
MYIEPRMSENITSAMGFKILRKDAPWHKPRGIAFLNLRITLLPCLFSDPHQHDDKQDQMMFQASG